MNRCLVKRSLGNVELVEPPHSAAVGERVTFPGFKEGLGNTSSGSTHRQSTGCLLQRPAIHHFSRHLQGFIHI
ncbi:hypothetical protein CsSME_00024881 [Camellia sinensis var. sinensis]